MFSRILKWIDERWPLTPFIRLALEEDMSGRGRLRLCIWQRRPDHLPSAGCDRHLAALLLCADPIRCNKERHPHPEHVKESMLLEVTWTVIPTILVILMFYFGWVDFEYIRNPPTDAMSVNVTARQWSWLFDYENGRQSDMLRVPAGKPVRLVMTSADVLHCLYIPAYRIKEDCVPGMKTHLWFTANAAGYYDIFCTEYCGVGHSHMRSKLSS